MFTSNRRGCRWAASVSFFPLLVWLVLPSAIADDQTAGSQVCLASLEGDSALDQFDVSRLGELLNTRSGTSSQCLIRATEASEKLSRGTALLVDLRPSDRYSTYRIADSVNSTTLQLSHGLLAPGRPIFLVGPDHRYAELESTCDLLRSKGFADTRVVLGGVPALAKILPTVGAPLPVAQTQRLTAQVFLSELSSGRWIVIDISEKQLGTAVAPRYGFSMKTESVKSPAAQTIATLVRTLSPKFPNAQFVLVDEKDTSSADFASLLNQEGIDVLYLAGGWAGFEQALKNQVAAWKHSYVSSLKRARCEGNV